MKFDLFDMLHHKFYTWQAFIQDSWFQTVRCHLVDNMQMAQNIHWNSFLVWQTLQNDDNLILANGAKAFRRKTPAQPIYTTVHCGKENKVQQNPNYNSVFGNQIKIFSNWTKFRIYIPDHICVIYINQTNDILYEKNQSNKEMYILKTSSIFFAFLFFTH